MGIEENKAIIRGYYESTGQKEIRDWIRKTENPDEIEHMLKGAMKELFSPECIIHYPEGDKPIDEDIKNLTVQMMAFPDIKATVHDIVAEGDKVVTRFTMNATHEKPFLGIPATGKKIKLDGVSIYRIIDGKVVEGWWIGNMLGVMQQIGAIPTN